MFYWIVVKPDSLPLLQRESAEQSVVLAPYPHAFPPVGADIDYFRLHLMFQIQIPTLTDILALLLIFSLPYKFA